MNIIARSVFIFTLLIILTLPTFAQLTLKDHIGLNVNLSTTSDYLQADEVCDNFREFNSWRSATYGANFLFRNENDTIPNNWPTKSSSDLHPDTTTYKYNFDANYETMYRVLSGNGNSIFPAFTTMHHYLTTTAVVNNYTGVGTALDYISQQSLQRKPVPHLFDTLNSKLILAPNESYTKPESYRFFGEYVSYMTIVFGENIFDLEKRDVYIDADIQPFVGRDQMKYIEFINEPDAWWTWSVVEGYYQPDELATAVSVAYDGHGGQVTTDVYDNHDTLPIYPDFECGAVYHAPDIKLISPGLHEMNIQYLDDFLQALDTIRAADSIPAMDFDVYNFHHYSAYRVDDLKTLVGENLTAQGIVTPSLQPKKFSPKVGDVYVPITTVLLETSVAGSNETKIWIHPELDGYKLRGPVLRKALDSIGCNPESEIWLTEWGFPSIVQPLEAQYHDITPPLASARWMIRGFIEYMASGEIDQSYWHKYKDQYNDTWDNKCGLVDQDEHKKLGWYYLDVLNKEIGDKTLAGMRDVDNCGEHFAWSYDLNTLKPIRPESMITACPRIYQFDGDTDTSFEDDVWVTWIPSAADLIPSNKAIKLVDLFGGQLPPVIPNSYSIVQDYYVTDSSTIDSIQPRYPISFYPDASPYIIPKISDEPIFLHFKFDFPTTGIDTVTIVDTMIIVDTMTVDTMIIVDTMTADTMTVDTMGTDTTMVDTTMIDTTVMNTFIPKKWTINIFPNPARNSITIDLSHDVIQPDYVFVFTDILGTDVLRIKAKRRNHLPLGLPAGIYFCSLMSRDEVLGVERVVVY